MAFFINVSPETHPWSHVECASYVPSITA